MRAIDADALIKDRIENGVNWYLGESEGFRQLIERQPTITERTATLKLDRGQKYCSECFERALSYYYYCPNCGAKFEEVSDGR